MRVKKSVHIFSIIYSLSFMVTVSPLQCRLYYNNLAQYLAYLFCLRNTILIRLSLLSAYTLVEKATNVNNLIR